MVYVRKGIANSRKTAFNTAYTMKPMVQTFLLLSLLTGCAAGPQEKQGLAEKTATAILYVPVTALAGAFYILAPEEPKPTDKWEEIYYRLKWEMDKEKSD